jgi:hypothetical protein
MFDKTRLGRRTLLKAIGLTVPAFMVSPWNSIAALIGNNPIANENKKPGTTDWLITNPADNREIEGYASWTYIDPGQSIDIFVNTGESSYRLEVFRLGWYGGTGGRRVFEPITRSGIQQTIPTPDPVTGLIECRWSNPFTLRTGSNWTTGVYLVKLTGSQSGKQSYVPFTLRNGPSFSQILFQNSVTTYQAYNAWGGKSLYDFNSTDSLPAVKVSFNRPYDRGNGAGQLFLWELSMLRFLEREGYDVEYCTNMTTHRSASLIRNHKAFISVGHDEYWSAEMRRNVTTIRDQGVHLGFFGANNCYWQIRMEPSPVTGQPRRTIVCYRDRQKDPLFGVDNARVTELWRSDIVNQPEEQLIGVQYDFFPVNADLVVSNANHFIFEGTGLGNGDHLPGLLGYEADRTFGGGPANLIRLCSSPISSSPTARGRSRERFERKTSEELGATTSEQQQSLAVQESASIASTGNSEMTIYKARSGALVFATGSMQFNWGLDDGTDSTLTPLVNPAAQRMVRNLFRRFDSNNDDD